MKWLLDLLFGKWFDHRYNKKLSNHNANNDKKIYVSKVKFDAEFQMYKELSKSCFDLVLAFSPILPGFEKVPKDDADKKTYYEDIYKNAVKQTQLFQDVLFSYAPFISENIYNILREIQQLCRNNLLHFEWIHFDKIMDKLQTYREGNKIHDEIQTKHTDFIDVLRKYLNSLDVKNFI